MHEVGLAQSICETVQPLIPPQQRVVRVVVEVGPLCGVVPDALEFCFPLVARQYGMEEAVLDLRRLEAAATCPACRATFAVDSMWCPCPECAHAPVTVQGGRELEIREFDVIDL